MGYRKNGRRDGLVEGIDFGNRAPSGEFFMYLATLVSVRGTDGLAHGFSIENLQIESGDHEADH